MKKIKKFFKYLNDNPRIKAIFKLGLWFIFFAFFFVIAMIISAINPRSNNTNKPKEEKTDVISKLENIRDASYEYEYTITINNEKTTFNGSKYQNIYRGYKENNNGIIKYQIEDGNSYQITGDYFSPVDNIYGDINTALVNLDSIVELLSNHEYEEVSGSYVYVFDDKTITVTITDVLTNIIIHEGDNDYILNYKNINKVDEIKRISD